MGSQHPKRQLKQGSPKRPAAQCDAAFDALTSCWWVERRDDPALRTQLNKALCVHWLELIEAGLVRNRELGRTPANWSELAAALTRDRTSINRWINGQARASAIDLVALATLLGVPPRDFLPEQSKWVESATYLMCAGEASREESRAYALYRLAYPQTKRFGLDPVAVQTVVDALHGWTPEDVSAAVNKVADCLGRALVRPPGKKHKK